MSDFIESKDYSYKKKATMNLINVKPKVPNFVDDSLQHTVIIYFFFYH